MESHTLHVLRYCHRLVTAGQQQTLFLNCQTIVQKSTTSLVVVIIQASYLTNT